LDFVRFVPHEEGGKAAAVAARKQLGESLLASRRSVLLLNQYE